MDFMNLKRRIEHLILIFILVSNYKKEILTVVYVAMNFIISKIFWVIYRIILLNRVIFYKYLLFKKAINNAKRNLIKFLEDKIWDVWLENNIIIKETDTKSECFQYKIALEYGYIFEVVSSTTTIEEIIEEPNLNCIKGLVPKTLLCNEIVNECLALEATKDWMRNDNKDINRLTKENNKKDFKGGLIKVNKKTKKKKKRRGKMSRRKKRGNNGVWVL
ncbi:hypothetical protein TCON_2788 [Astathelohania contejeani]|uniref:Uncharacterized protein n=1 Tax=Astathelohania contejeani TaxID=164912 RepID=A0ABQ7HV16_9MICR|nr:hypothetical protein TCON_2788 [Thelohania contejeani]